MPDLVQYGAHGSAGTELGFGPLKGPDAVEAVVYLAVATTGQVYTITSTTDVFMMPLDWTSVANENVDAGFYLQGTSDVADTVRVTVVTGDTDTPYRSWVFATKVGANLLTVPFVLHNVPAGTNRWRLKMKTGSGTLTMPTGLSRWFVERKG